MRDLDEVRKELHKNKKYVSSEGLRIVSIAISKAKNSIWDVVQAWDDLEME